MVTLLTDLVSFLNRVIFDGIIVTDAIKVRRTWKKYFDNLLNEEKSMEESLDAKMSFRVLTPKIEDKR